MDYYTETISNTSASICRICLQSFENGICLFNKDEASKNILDMIYSCFQVILMHKQHLPDKICNLCFDELQSANNFRLKCVSFEERYSKYCKIVYAFDQLEDTEIQNNHSEDFGLTSNTVLMREVDSKWQCDICDKILKSKAVLTKHKQSVHREKAPAVSRNGNNHQYHCTECSYVTPYNTALQNHMRRHTGEKPYHCECGKSFAQTAALTAHKKIHDSTFFHICATCGRQFKHSYTLKNHLRVHETGQFECRICSKVLKSPRALKDHINRHNNIRNYNCETCGGTFVTSNELIIHKKIHNNDKQIECHMCGYKTYAKRNLIIHIKRHTGDKAYKCEFCSKTEYTKSDLRRHQRVHSREKPYPCSICTHKFSRSGYLAKHMHNSHGLIYQWNQCKPGQIMPCNIKEDK